MLSAEPQRTEVKACFKTTQRLETRKLALSLLTGEVEEPWFQKKKKDTYIFK